MNFSRWKDLRGGHVPTAEMDWRHVCMVNAVLVNEKPKSVVEFGCWKGFSSASIIEAMETCPEIEQAHFLDPDMKTELMAHHAPPRLNVVNAPSQSFKGSPEFWLIDGDHNQGAIDDYTMAKMRLAKIIVIHDTHSFYVMGHHEGSRNIGAACQIHSLESFLDCRIRTGEFTERGLIIGFMEKPKPETLAALQQLRDANYESLITT